MKLLLRAACLLASLLPLAAQDHATERLNSSPRHHEWVPVTHGDRTVNLFVVFPEVAENATVVLVIHENRGLNPWARAFADELAEAGFIAVAPDLLSGQGPDGGGTASFATTDDARNALYQLDRSQVSADLVAARDYAAAIPAGNGKVAVAGFCWGGSQCFAMATRHEDVEAALVFYGTGPREASDYEGVTAPVYGFYGGNDQRVNATIEASRAAMTAAGKTYEPVIYEDAGHGFMRSGDGPDASGPNKVARDAGFERAVRILRDL